MEPQNSIEPKLSVIVPALFGYNSVLAALDSWEAQSCRDQLEILVLCPSSEGIASPPSGQLVIETGSLLLHEVRALGVRRAAADYIVLAEDHCLPDPTWAARILERIEEHWDGVGPALRSGNPSNAWTRASFLLGYGQWMMPAGGPTSVLPGHNVVLRTQILLDLGPRLDHEMIVSALLMGRLGAQGQRFYLEQNATMRHFDPPLWTKELQIFYCVGQGFGAVRTSRWPSLARALYGLAAPVIAARHMARGLIQYARVGRKAGFGFSSLAAASVLAAAWGCGESIGALKGVSRIAPILWLSEVKPVSREDVRTSRG